jgi:hypothetical protein
MIDKVQQIKEENADILELPMFKEMYSRLADGYKYQPRKDDELKEIAKCLYHGTIFSDRHLKYYNQYLIPNIFMPLALGAFPDITWDMETREGKIINLILYDLEPEYNKRRDEYKKNIGFIYEYIDKAGPRGINGFPIFMSFNILSIDDTDRMFKYYEKYKEIQEKINDQL